MQQVPGELRWSTKKRACYQSNDGDGSHGDDDVSEEDIDKEAVFKMAAELKECGGLPVMLERYRTSHLYA